MGTTTNFSFPYPEGADANDVPADMQALADSVDAHLASIQTYPTMISYLDCGDATTDPVPGDGSYTYWNDTIQTVNYQADHIYVAEIMGLEIIFDQVNWMPGESLSVIFVRDFNNENNAALGRYYFQVSASGPPLDRWTFNFRNRIPGTPYNPTENLTFRLGMAITNGTMQGSASHVISGSAELAIWDYGPLDN